MRLSPSPAAQFQATKTRAVFGVQLFFHAGEPPAPPGAQLSEPEIAAQITARAARSTEF
jgi:hypothetical protein